MPRPLPQGRGLFLSLWLLPDQHVLGRYGFGGLAICMPFMSPMDMPFISLASPFMVFAIGLAAMPIIVALWPDLRT